MPLSGNPGRCPRFLPCSNDCHLASIPAPAVDWAGTPWRMVEQGGCSKTTGGALLTCFEQDQIGHHINPKAWPAVPGGGDENPDLGGLRRHHCRFPAVGGAEEVLERPPSNRRSHHRLETLYGPPDRPRRLKKGGGPKNICPLLTFHSSSYPSSLVRIPDWELL